MYARALASALAVAFLTLAAASSSGRPSSPTLKGSAYRAAFAQTGAFRPVTDDRQNPPASDWLHWRRTYDRDIATTRSTGRTSGAAFFAWSWAMQEATSNDAARSRRRDVSANPGGTVQALNAATGETLWSAGASF
jgi:hypothetical protein